MLAVSSSCFEIGSVPSRRLLLGWLCGRSPWCFIIMSERRLPAQLPLYNRRTDGWSVARGRWSAPAGPVLLMRPSARFTEHACCYYLDYWLHQTLSLPTGQHCHCHLSPVYQSIIYVYCCAMAVSYACPVVSRSHSCSVSEWLNV